MTTQAWLLPTCGAGALVASPAAAAAAAAGGVATGCDGAAPPPTATIHARVRVHAIEPPAGVAPEAAYRVVAQLHDRTALTASGGGGPLPLTRVVVDVARGQDEAHVALPLALGARVAPDAAVSYALYAARRADSYLPDAAAAASSVVPTTPYRFVGRALLPLALALRAPERAPATALVFPAGLGACCEEVQFAASAARATVRAYSSAPTTPLPRAAAPYAGATDALTPAGVAAIRAASHELEARIAADMRAAGAAPECPDGPRLFQRMRVLPSTAGATLVVHPCSWSLLPAATDPLDMAPEAMARVVAAAVAAREAREGTLWHAGVAAATPDLQAALHAAPWRVPADALLALEEARLARVAAAAAEAAAVELVALATMQVTKHLTYAADDVLVPCAGCGAFSGGDGPALRAGDLYGDVVGTGRDWCGDCDDCGRFAYRWAVRFRDCVPPGGGGAASPGEPPLLARMRAALRAHYRICITIGTALAANPNDRSADDCVQGHMFATIIPRVFDGVRRAFLLEGTSQMDPTYRPAPRGEAVGRLARALRGAGHDPAALRVGGEAAYGYAPKDGARGFYQVVGGVGGVDMHAEGHVWGYLSRAAPGGVGVPIATLMDPAAAAAAGVRTTLAGRVTDAELRHYASLNVMMPSEGAPAPPRGGAPAVGIDADPAALPPAVAALVRRVAAAKADAAKYVRAATPRGRERGGIALLSYPLASVTDAFADALGAALARCGAVAGVDAYVERVYDGLEGVVVAVTLA